MISLQIIEKLSPVRSRILKVRSKMVSNHEQYKIDKLTSLESAQSHFLPELFSPAGSQFPSSSIRAPASSIRSYNSSFKEHNSNVKLPKITSRHTKNWIIRETSPIIQEETNSMSRDPISENLNHYSVLNHHQNKRRKDTPEIIVKKKRFTSIKSDLKMLDKNRNDSSELNDELLQQNRAEIRKNILKNFNLDNFINKFKAENVVEIELDRKYNTRIYIKKGLVFNNPVQSMSWTLYLVLKTRTSGIS